MALHPRHLSDLDLCVDILIERFGPDLRVALPLGLGKPIKLVNALYARAKTDSRLRLTLLTALSLEKPVPGSELEAAFLQPFLDRVFEGVADLDYARDQSAGTLPHNVRVVEFFFRPGSRLQNAQAQRDYVCTNYTFAARDVFAQGCNVVLQSVARVDGPEGPRYSLSCNPDTAPELIELLREAESRRERRVGVFAVVDPSLPFMAHDAEVAEQTFDFVLDDARTHSALSSTPRTPVSLTDYAIGLQAAALVRDGGTLQIGIGSLGDAVAQALILRHRNPVAFGDALDALGIQPQQKRLIEEIGGAGAFQHGLYGATEMFVDGFLQLMQAGILKRRVYDFWALQHLVNAGLCDPEQLTPEVLDQLDALGVQTLRAQDVAVLQHHGLLRDDLRFEQGYLQFSDGSRVIANLGEPRTRAAIARSGLGSRLRNGLFLHGGFFLGPRDFYRTLRDMDPELRNGICMTGVNKVNQLDLNPRLYREQRIHARFLNSAMMATVNGAVVSDGLADGRVVSGVGGQYNFVAQAHQLPTGRSVLMLRAVREAQGGKKGRATSNLLIDYAHCTIPRHLRDILITEYGVADLRAQTDSEVAKRVLNLADSRFQPALLKQLLDSGRIEAGYEIPEAHRHNTPERLAQRLAAAQAENLLPAFPFGSDFTDQEWRLARALQRVRARAAGAPRWKLLLDCLLRWRLPTLAMREDLQRMQLERVHNLQQFIARALLVQALGELAEDG